jgi:hypothetical protein
MKLRHLFSPEKVIAQFGNKQLIKTPDGKSTLRGGSKSDHTAAKDFISLFLHEAVIARDASLIRC